MDNKDILSELYKMREIDDCIRKCVGETYFDDFKQELFLRLLEHGKSLKAAYAKNEHRFYITRVILSLANRKRDIFHKKFKAAETYELPEMYDIEDADELEARSFVEAEEERILNRIESIEQDTGRAYYRMLIEAVKRCGSYREVARQTGIPVASISGHMKLIREHLCKKS